MPVTAAAWDIVPNQGTDTDCTAVTGNTSGWVVFAAVDEPTGPPTITVNGLSAGLEGDGILVNAYLQPNGNAVHFTATLPDGSTINHTIAVSGPAYTEAQALADWTVAHENDASAVQAPDFPSPVKVRDTQFFQGRFTTLNGTRGTFWGPWTLTAPEATTNGELPPSGTLIAQPSFLWNDGNSYNGLGRDAFGVWRYPF